MPVDEKGFNRRLLGTEDKLLSFLDELMFGSWAQQNQAPDTPDYDMRGFWRALQQQYPGAQSAVASDGMMHYPDTWKKPNHQTFSSESIYATGGEPSWLDGLLYGPSGRIVADER